MTYKRLKTCLILEVAFASLVADGAVQRVVTEEEFHHSLSRLKRRDRRDIFLQNSTSKFSIFGCFEFEPEASKFKFIKYQIRPCLSGEVRVGVHFPAVHNGHRTGRHRLRRLFHLHEAHSALEKKINTLQDSKMITNKLKRQNLVSFRYLQFPAIERRSW